MVESSILAYRVWLLDNADNEIFKTVDTEIEVNVELDNLYDKALNAGWNWFSLNVFIEDMTLNSVLSTLEDGTATYIKSQSAFADYYSGYGWR